MTRTHVGPGVHPAKVAKEGKSPAISGKSIGW